MLNSYRVISAAAARLLVSELSDSLTTTPDFPTGKQHQKKKNPMSELNADIKNQIMIKD